MVKQNIEQEKNNYTKYRYKVLIEDEFSEIINKDDLL